MDLLAHRQEDRTTVLWVRAWGMKTMTLTINAVRAAERLTQSIDPMKPRRITLASEVGLPRTHLDMESPWRLT